MLTNEFMRDLRKLNRAEKLRIVQILLSDLAIEEDAIIATGTQFDSWSPHNPKETAATLRELLEDD